jgi:hypothetical protein
VNEYQQQLFGYLQQNKLIDETEESFIIGLQDSANTRELYQYLKEKNLVEEDEDVFVNRLTVPAQTPLQSENISGDEQVQAEIIQQSNVQQQFLPGLASDYPGPDYQLPKITDASPDSILNKAMSGEDVSETISSLASGNTVEDKSSGRFNQIASETESVLKRYYNTDDVRVVLGDSGVRSMEDQALYLQSGASQTPLSLHNYGEAADYQIFINGQLVDASQRSTSLEHSIEPYKILGGIAKKRGFFWGYPHDSGHVASFRYVDELLKNRPELADSEQTKKFYTQFRDTAPKGLEPVLTTLDGYYGQESQRVYTGEARIDNPLLDPINPYPEQPQEQVQEQVQEQPQGGQLNIEQLQELGVADMQGFAPPDISYTTGSRTKAPIMTFDAHYGETVQWLTEGFINMALELDEPGGWLQKVNPDLVKPATFARNVVSHAMEAPFIMALDLPQSAIQDPVGTVNGLFHFMKDEAEMLLAGINAHPKQLYLNYKGKTSEANAMRDEAIKHMWDTGGVYTYFMASGLTHAGIGFKNKTKYASEFRDIMEVVNDRPPIGDMTEQQLKVVETLNNNPDLKARADKISGEQLTLDFIEPAKAEQIIISADKVATKKAVDAMTKKTKKTEPDVESELNLDRDIPDSPPEIVSIDRWWDNSKKNHVITKRDANGNQIGEAEYEFSKDSALGRVSELEAEHGIVKKTKAKKKKVTTKPEPEVSAVERVKLEKSSDLNVGKGIEPIKGEKARRFKSQDKLDAYIENKLSEYIGQNVVARWGETSKGDYVVKIFKKLKEQPLPKTALKPPPLKIKTDAQEIASTMRDPRSRGIVDRKILVDKYTEEISEMRRGRSITDLELADLKLKQSIYESELGAMKKLESHHARQAEKHTKNGDTKKAEVSRRKADAEARKARKYVEEHGVGLGNRINIMENSIESYNKAINKAKSQQRLEMTNIELAKDTVKKINRLASPGAVGKGKKIKLTEEQIELRLDVAENIKEIWNRGHAGIKITTKGLKKALRDEGWDNKSIAYAIKNFDDIVADTQIQSSKTLARQLDAEASQTSGVVRDTETKTRSSDEYMANIRIESIAGKTPSKENLARVDLVQSIVDNIGGEGVETARGTRTIADIKRVGSSKRMMAEWAEEFLSGELRVDKLAERVEATKTGWSSLIDEWVKNPENPVNRDAAIEATKMLVSYYSEIPRALRYFRELSSADAANYFEKLVKSGELGKMHGDVIQAMRALLEGTEVKRHWLHKVAEGARNAKLATLSSANRSLGGNSVGSLDAAARMPFEIGWDFLIGKSSAGLHGLTGGKIGNLNGPQMSMLEIGAAWRGFRLGIPVGGKLSWQMLLEDKKALGESSFYYREALHNKEISGTKGVIIRTPQRIQGAIDMLFRVPLTNAYMSRFSIRQAISEGYKTNPEIIARAKEILNLEELSPEMMKLARESGEYATFQRELGVVGKWVNSMRVGPGPGPAVAQLIVPFFNTATNLLKWSVEHSPLEPFTPTFSRAFKDAYSASGSGSSPLAVQMGKMTTGIGTMWILSEMLGMEQEGRITGDWSELQPEERDLLTQQGMQEYSITTKDGNVISYRGFEPVGTYLVLADKYQRTDILKNATKGEILKAGEELYGVTRAFAQSFLENPFVMGAGNLAKVFDGRDDTIHYLVNLAAGAAMPGGLRQMRSIVDRDRRKRYKLSDWQNDEVTFSDMFMSQVYHVTPWMTDKNLPALDPFGRVIKNQDPVGSLYAWRQTQLKTDPVYQEVQRLYFDQEKGFAPATPWFSKSELAKLKLSKEEHHRLIQYSGDWLYSFMNGLLSWDEWNKPTPVEAAAQILSKNKTEERELLGRGEEILLGLDDKQLMEIRNSSMSDFERRKIINNVRERAFHAFRQTLYLPEYSEIEKEMGKLEPVDYFKNEEQKRAYRNERRQHYGIDEIGDNEYWLRIEKLVADARKGYNPRSATQPSKISQEAFKGLKRHDVRVWGTD